MKCLNCGNENFITKKERAAVSIKGENIDYIAIVEECDKCQDQSASDEIMQKNFITASDIYRKKHALLTTAEILQYRKSMNMNQEEFSNYLGVGAASLKRWESGHVQDKSTDELVRLKCSLEKLNDQLYDLESHQSVDPIFRGNRQFDFEMFANTVLLILKESKSSPLFFFKILFYVDFIGFKKNGKSLTGLTYSSMQYGPCPIYYRTLRDKLIKDGWVKRSGTHDLISVKTPDSNLFTDKELEVINTICSIIKDKGQKYLYDLSHDEEAWKNTEEDGLISYSFASNLLIKVYEF